MIEANKKTARAFMKALGNGDAAAMAALLTPDFQAVTAGYAAVSTARDRALVLLTCQALKQITKNGIDFEVLNVTAEDNRVSLESQGRSELIDGKRYDNQYHFLFHFRGDKICLLREYLDTQLADNLLGPYLAAAAAQAAKS